MTLLQNNREIPIWHINHSRINADDTLITKPQMFQLNQLSCSVDSAVDLIHLACLEYLTADDLQTFRQMGPLANELYDYHEERKKVTNYLKTVLQTHTLSTAAIREYQMQTRMQLSKRIKPIWNWLAENDPVNFATPFKGSDKACLDNFLPKMLSNAENDLFSLKIQLKCSVCNAEAGETQLCPFVLSEQTNSVCQGIETVMSRFGREQKCKECENDVSVQQMNMPKMLFVEIGFQNADRRNFKLSEQIAVVGQKYQLSGILKHPTGHFLSIVRLSNGDFAILNDLNDDVPIYRSCLEALQSLCRTNPMSGVMWMVYRTITDATGGQRHMESFVLDGASKATTDKPKTNSRNSECIVGMSDAPPNKRKRLQKKNVTAKPQKPAFLVDCDPESVVIMLTQMGTGDKTNGMEADNVEPPVCCKKETADQRNGKRRLARERIARWRAQQVNREREQHKLTIRREKETTEERAERNIRNKRRLAVTRELETVHERAVRQTTSKRRMADKREMETPNETAKRQTTNKCRMQERRDHLSTVENEYFDSISEIPDAYCGSCRKILFPQQCFNLEKNTKESRKLGLKTGDCVCKPCRTTLANSNSKTPVKAWTNQLETDSAPQILKDLTFLERRFICRVQTYMTMLSLPAGGQYAQEGLAIHFPSQPDNLLSILPMTMENAGIICVSGTYEAYIRPGLICAALKWLKRNNSLYRDVKIDWHALPPTPDNNVPVPAGTAGNLKSVMQTGIISTDYDMPKMSMAEFLKSGGDRVTFPWSHEPPLSFGDTQNAEALSFPWLFCKGRYHSDSPREDRLTLLQYLQSRLLNIDPRFRMDIPYLITAVNRYEHLKLKQLVDLYMKVRRTVKTGCTQTTVPVTAGDIMSLPNNPDLAHNSTMFLKTIRGTSSYWKEALSELLAKIRTIGPPDRFLTLSVDDTHWHELKAAMDNDFPDEVHSLSAAVRNNPAIAALYADHRFKALLKYIVNSKVIGSVTDYHGRTEFQNRGSCHYHCFLWGAADVKTLQKGDSAVDVTAFIDSIISTSIPTDDDDLAALVTSRQMHAHTQSCQAKAGRCRFHYPRRPCKETRILYQSDASVRKRGQFYETKRMADEGMVVSYNADILKRWRANLDLQMINGADGLAYYVCKYALKAEPESLKEKIADLLQRMDRNEKLTQQGRMFKLGMTVLKHRRMCAQEAACRILSIPLIYSTRDVVRVNTLMPDKRMRRAKRNLCDLDANDTNCFDDDLVDVYRKRPVALEEITLFEFASWWKVDSSATVGQKSRTAVHSLMDESGTIRKRSKFVCIKPSHLSMNTEGYHYSLLVLYKPHRTEEELRMGFADYRTSFMHCQENHLLNTKNLPHDTITDEVVAAAQRLRVATQLMELDFTEDDAVCQQSEIPAEAAEESNPAAHFRDEPMIDTDKMRYNQAEEQLWHNLTVTQDSVRNLETDIQRLNSDQRRVFKMVHKKVVADKEQLLLFITGNAGTGKTFLLKTLANWLRLTQSKFTGHDPVMIGAPTGKAAKLISGRTLHSLLKLPVQHGAQPQYYNLREVTIRKLRQEIGNKLFLIIDEISMVAKEMLTAIHRRLCQLFDRDSDKCLFGGINVILSGDFFQLRPVRGQYAFASSLFDMFDPLFLLQNMRQKEDIPWCDLLNRLKIGQLTEEDISMLDSRARPREELLEVDADIRLYPTKRMVAEYNEYCQNKLPANLKTSAAEDVYSENDLNAGCSVPTTCLPKDDTVAGGLLKKLEISVGSRIMLTKNLGDGLINGSLGEVVKFGYNGELLNSVYVKFDDENAGQIWADPNVDNAVPIERTTVDYLHSGRFMERKQYPLMPAWSLTHHKAQGMTVDSAVINVCESFSEGQVYVALSRVRKLENLHIEDKFQISKVRVSKDVLNWALTAKDRFRHVRKQLKGYHMAALL